ncbi:hypothetical protein GPECTOR_32g487 [Gonium pectorale]|uniref:Uncharacterized protein n=1 Tax=Gonium pectorale TaxID=33097 RepID=A0A150GDG1_GONPE|nr:hypothetical protein GPECTOR_32g487 [Gonium pectorale]|eukprot:KXZ47874.1 hypothetical protein GPECTOR_32g487 [Gonium pectorale]
MCSQNFQYKGHKGGLLEKLKHVASQHNSPSHSPTGSRAGSHVASRGGSEKSAKSRRDAYDVSSDEEDLEGFIYDDESTSEDEREDYVNAFSRKKKAHKPDDYSEYEGANVRAMTAGRIQAPKSAAMRRAAAKDASDEDDDGDDEFDPEEEKIRVLRQQKRQQEKMKAAALATRAAVAIAEPGRGKHADGAGPGPSTAAAAGGHSHGHGHPHGAHVRMAPAPPSEPPARGSSGNIRRGAAAAGASGSSYGGGGSGGASGPGPGPGAGRGAGVPSPSPPPVVNYGSSASSQYWQAKRTQDADYEEDDNKPAMSRLEQLQALQKKRNAALERQQKADSGSGGDSGGGVRWQQQQADVAEAAPGRNGQLRLAQHLESRLQEPAAPLGQRVVLHKTSSVKEFPQEGQDDEERTKYFRSRTTGPSKMADRGGQSPPQDRDGGAARDSQGQRTIKIVHLEPPPRPFAPSPRPSEGVKIGVPAPPLHPPPRPKGSEDFDIDEMLESFAPAPPQQWAGGRPQPPTTPPPAKDFTPGFVPQQNRSIRAVQSDFTSMRPSEIVDVSGEVAARIMSLPVAASRPMPNSPVNVVASGASVPGGGGGGAVAAGMNVSAAGSQPASRFARLGANLNGPGDDPAAGPAAWPTSSGGYGARAASPRTSQANAQSPFRGTSISSVSGSPARLPRASIQDSDDGSGGGAPFQTSLSGPFRDGGPAGSGGGASPLPRRNSNLGTGLSPRSSGAGCGDVALPVIRPGSGSSGGGGRGSDSGGGSILSALPGATVGRSRFSVAQPPPQQPQQYLHQQQEERMRSSVPTLPSQQTARDYDSDSALTSR